MAKLLYIEASPRKDRSASIAVAREFLAAYKAAHAGDTVETLDLWHCPLPDFDGETINAKYAIMHGQPHTAQQKLAWDRVVQVIEQFKAADRYLFSLPMWNFGIPYKLKHYIDVITQPGLTFSFSPDTGYKGLVTGKPAVVVYARGGAYGTAGANGMDYQKSYFETLLGFIGFTDVRPVLIEPTISAPDAVEKTLAAAKATARELAKVP